MPDVGAERILFFLGEGRVMNDRLNRKGAQPVWKSHEKTSAEKEAWLRPFEEDENLRMMDEETLAKARRYTEELCREDNVFALRLKGYACYGGNRLYECDWTAARDCMLRLRELADDAEYANTLGTSITTGAATGASGVREGVPAVQLCGGQRAVRGNLQAGGPVQPRVRLPEKRGDSAEPVPHGVQRDQEKIPPGL